MNLRGPILLAPTLRGGQAFRWRLTEGGYAAPVGSRLVTLAQRGDGSVEATATPRATAAFFASYFRLEDDYEAALDRLGRDPGLVSAVRAHRGLRLLRQDPWETLCGFIASANNNVPRIELILERLAAAAGVRLDGPRGAFYAFPGPGAVAGMSEAALRACGLGYRAPLLHETALAVATGGFPLAKLRGRPYDRVQEALLELPGVGPKVADCVALFALDAAEAFPVDRWIARIVGDAYPGDAPARERDVGGWARERWGRDAGLAQQLLFHDARVRGVGARPGRRAPGLGAAAAPRA